ncbi:MAG: aminotransferase class I/II-fold pyridoxal phosphate-dependent enzyme, partial [Mesorhizobium sp.]
MSFVLPQSSSSARYAFDGVRAQIRDLHTENIANLAVRARELGDVIALWYGEGDVVTPAFIRDAAKAAFDEGLTFYVPNMRGHGPLNEALSEYQTRIHGRPIPIARTTVTPGGMQALYLALELLVDIGTNVVYVAPQWPNIHNAIHL